MKICPKCGNKNSDKVSFCEKCGTKLSDVVIDDIKRKVNALGIISFIIGIIVFIYTIYMVLGLNDAPYKLKNLLLAYNSSQEYIFAFSGFLFGYTLRSLIPGVIGTVFGVVSRVKNNSLISKIAIFLNSCGIIGSIISIFYILINM